MKKIVFTISSLSSGGAERVLSLVANALSQKGYDVYIITICKHEIFYEFDSNIKIIELDLCGVSQNKLQAISRNYQMIKQLRGYFKSLRPDVIISFMNTVNIISIIANLGLNTKIIISEHIDYSFCALGTIWSILQKVFYKYADYLVSVSKGVESNFDFLDDSKKVVIYNPVDKDIIQKADINTDNIDVSQYNDYIISIGRLEKQKRYDTLIRSFSLLQDKTINLLIFGDGSQKSELLELIKESHLENRVFLMGRVKNPYYYLKRAKFFVMSSEYEGFGNVLIEAMSCKLPVISFDCPSGPKEIITHNTNGLLVANQDIQALAHSMQNLIDDESLRQQYANEASKILQIYSIQTIITQWEKLING